MNELVRKTLAELIGTALLVAAVVGSGIAAVRLSPGEAGLQLLENSVATGAALVATILAIGPVSGAHLNPVVTLADRVLGGLTNAEAAAYVAAQLAGGALGAVLANLMFELPAVTVSGHVRSAGGLWLGEVVATLRAPAGRLRRRPVETRHRRALRRWCLHRGGVLVHQLDQLREPGRDRGPHPLRHLRRHRAGVSARLRGRAGRRRGAGPGRRTAAQSGRDAGGRAARRTARARGRRNPLPEGAFDDDTVDVPTPRDPGRLPAECRPEHCRRRAAGPLREGSGRRTLRRFDTGPGDPPGDPCGAGGARAVHRGADPKAVHRRDGAAADVVVTMGCGEACPVFPGKRYLDWTVEDPHGQPRDVVRRIVDDIDGRVRTLLADLLPGEALAEPPQPAAAGN